MIFHVGCQYKVIHVGQGSPTYGPRAKCGHFKKTMALFKSKAAKEKGHQKNLGRLAKKYELMALGKRRSLIFPFFGPPTTKGWRLLM